MLSSGGAGSTGLTPPSPITTPEAPDLSWQFRVQASLPLFTSGARGATRQQTGINLERLEVEQKATHLAVEQRIRAALELAASSYTAIALTRDAAQAADRNYDLVRDAYGRRDGYDHRAH